MLESDVTIHVGLGTLSGQVDLDGSQTVGDAYAEVVALAHVADEVGFDSFWVSEHHGSVNSHVPSPLLMLAAAAGVTRRITLGTAMVIAPLQHPLRFAEDCAVVDQLSRGRLVVGIGLGYSQHEFASFGISMKERVARMSELVAICRAAWQDDVFSFSGRHYSFDNARVTPKPVNRLRLVMGGSSPNAVARAGRLADAFIGTGTPQCTLPVFQAQVSTFDEAARAAGRDPANLPIGFHVNAWVTRGGDVPSRVLRAMWQRMAISRGYVVGEEVRSARDLPPVDEGAVRATGFMGTPEEVLAQARPWIEPFRGRDLHVLFRLHHVGLALDESEECVRLFADEVIPGLRQLAGT